MKTLLVIINIVVLLMLFVFIEENTLAIRKLKETDTWEIREYNSKGELFNCYTRYFKEGGNS